MRPKEHESKEFERKTPDEWLKSRIIKIKRDEERKCTFQGETSIKDCVQLVFKIEGCQDDHYSTWMTFSYGDRSNLYNKILTPLVENAQPFMDFDITRLEGMYVKTMWEDVPMKNGTIFQKLAMIRPLKEKLPFEAERNDGVIDDTAEYVKNIDPNVQAQLDVNEFTDEDLKPDTEVPF